MSFEAPDREPFYLFRDAYGCKGALHYVCEVRSQYEGVMKARAFPQWHLYSPHTGDVIYIPPGEMQPTRVDARKGWRERAASSGARGAFASGTPTAALRKPFLSRLFTNPYAALAGE
jgi:hypothetical protein